MDELLTTIHALEAELSAIDAALGFDDGSTRSAGDRVARIKALRAEVRDLNRELDELEGWLDD